MRSSCGLDASSEIVIVGASAAGLTAAETLRREGFGGTITIVGEEVREPYDRPPLSKQLLRGDWEPERLALRRRDVLDALDVRWMLGIAATRLDVPNRRVSLSNGSHLDFDGLVIATGVRPRSLPMGHDLSGVDQLRSLDDALRFRRSLSTARSLVVVGAGFLGSEVASVARSLGLGVTLVEPLEGPMVRQLGTAVSARVARLHAERGVDVRCRTSVIGMTGTDGRVTGIDLDDGSHVSCDAVLVAVGSVPATTWLAGSGLDLTNGVVCDQLCRADDGIVAAGDVASWEHPRFGRLRLEHRMNATEHGTAAALSLLGRGEPFEPVPYFWSDQYDVRIQAYGIPSSTAAFNVVSGSIDADRFAGVYSDGASVVAALAWNMPTEARRLRARVAEESHGSPSLTGSPP